MKALIHNGRVCELHATGFPVAPPLVFVDVPVGLDVVPDAWRYAAGAFVAPAPPSKAELNAPLLAAIAAKELTQARAVREHVLGDATAKPRLQTIDDEIKALRAMLVV